VLTALLERHWPIEHCRIGWCVGCARVVRSSSDIPELQSHALWLPWRCILSSTAASTVVGPILLVIFHRPRGCGIGRGFCC
jgi:hypothetical protein